MFSLLITIADNFQSSNHSTLLCSKSQSPNHFTTKQQLSYTHQSSPRPDHDGLSLTHASYVSAPPLPVLKTKPHRREPRRRFNHASVSAHSPSQSPPSMEITTMAAAPPFTQNPCFASTAIPNHQPNNSHSSFFSTHRRRKDDGSRRE
ncbi:hypothetical protein M0R45_035811 [Rubus argutus]|uniref:Uncharacterized protein n=1 Tax=Rubus argutus TaxID=59490 RepID=A0AAW1VY15_RUBAR